MRRGTYIGMRTAGRRNPFHMAQGVNDADAFIMWQRFGALQKAYGTYQLEGAAKVKKVEQQKREEYRLTCHDNAANALARAATNKSPAHMKTDVDRIVFNRDHDSSEAVENALLSRLQKQRPQSAMPALAVPRTAAAEAAPGRLQVGTPLGASRPSAVRPRPSSGGRLTQMMHVQRQTPEFKAEMEKHRRKMVLAWANSHGGFYPAQGMETPEKIPYVPSPNAFHTTRR